MRLHKTLVKPVQLYRCETWKMKKWDDRTVDVYMFHNKCLRRILQFQWQEHVNTRELLERADIKPMSEEVKQRRWKMMEYYYTKTGPKRRLQHRNNLGTRRKKNRKIKNHLGAERLKRKEQKQDGNRGRK